ncbi:MAG: hypothetical protein ABJF10_06965 [Chthoniobacter sp.]|uniref:hypothetical protein n=1 Tax=Chthoniobacter sp. TaxID=2510640 RepID=UPI0032A54E88
MNRFGLLSVLFLVATLTAQGQAPATSKSVYLDAVESTGSSKTVNHWRDISGNYSQTKTSSRELAITVRNMSALPGEFELEWYFFGKPASGSGRFLYDKGSKKMTVSPGASEKVAIDSKELSNHTVRDYYYWGYNYSSGDKADGWILRVKVGEEVVRVKASNPLLEQLAADEAGFAKLTRSKK